MKTEKASPARCLWRLVRAFHFFVVGTGWTDLGVATALIVCGSLSCDAGHGWRGFWCFMLGIMVYVKAPRPNHRITHTDK
jgi:hypothetical protein